MEEEWRALRAKEKISDLCEFDAHVAPVVVAAVAAAAAAAAAAAVSQPDCPTCLEATARA